MASVALGGAPVTTLAAEIQARKDGDAKLQSQVDALTARVSKLEQAAVPVPTPGPAPVIRSASSISSILSLIPDNTVDVIDCGGKVLVGSLAVRVLDLAGEAIRTPRTRPLVIRNGTLDGGGGATPAIRLGTNSGGQSYPSGPTVLISFEDWTVQNYALGKDGLLMTGWVSDVAFRRFAFRNNRGIGGSYSHHAYVQNGGNPAQRGKRVVLEDLDIVAGKDMNGIQVFPKPNVDGLTIRRVSITGVNTGMYVYGDPTLVDIDGVTFTDCSQTIDAKENPQGVVRNSTSVRSGPLAPGSGQWTALGLKDGGGNQVAAA